MRRTLSALTLAVIASACGNVSAPSPTISNTSPPTFAPGRCILGTTPDCATVIPLPPTPAVPALSVSLASVETVLGQATLLQSSPLLQSHQATDYAWVFGDGNSTHTMSYAVQHTYTSLGVYSVSVTVTDDTGRTATGRGTVTVVAPPVVQPVPPPPSPPLVNTVECASVAVGTATGCHVTVSEGSTQRTSQVTNVVWDWGDGTTFPTGTVTGTHTYLVPGTYVVVAVATIADGRDVQGSTKAVVK